MQCNCLLKKKVKKFLWTFGDVLHVDCCLLQKVQLKICLECKQGIPSDQKYNGNYHKECFIKKQERLEKSRLDKSVEIKWEDNYPVYILGLGEEFFYSLEQIEECCDDLNVPVPEYAFSCEKYIFEIDIEEYIAGIIDDMDISEDYDYYSDLKDLDKLKEAVKLFEEKNSDIFCFYLHFAQKIKLSSK